MKKELFIGVLTLVSSFAFSQSKNQDSQSPEISEKKECMHNHEEKMNHMKDKMAKELNLNEDQIKQINAIDDKYKAQEEALRTKAETLRGERHQLRDQKRSEVEKILNEDQKQKLKDMKEHFHNNRRNDFHKMIK